MSNKAFDIQLHRHFTNMFQHYFFILMRFNLTCPYTLPGGVPEQSSSFHSSRSRLQTCRLLLAASPKGMPVPPNTNRWRPCSKASKSHNHNIKQNVSDKNR